MVVVETRFTRDRGRPLELVLEMHGNFVRFPRIFPSTIKHDERATSSWLFCVGIPMRNDTRVACMNNRLYPSAQCFLACVLSLAGISLLSISAIPCYFFLSSSISFPSEWCIRRRGHRAPITTHNLRPHYCYECIRGIRQLSMYYGASIYAQIIHMLWLCCTLFVHSLALYA